jgi:hypothetical protein
MRLYVVIDSIQKRLKLTICKKDFYLARKDPLIFTLSAVLTKGDYFLYA